MYGVEQDLSSGPGRTQQNLMDLAGYGRMRQTAIRLLLDCYFTVGLFLLRQQKQVDVYKVLRRCPIPCAVEVQQRCGLCANTKISNKRLYHRIYSFSLRLYHYNGSQTCRNTLIESKDCRLKYRSILNSIIAGWCRD